VEAWSDLFVAQAGASAALADAWVLLVETHRCARHATCRTA
jgi:hypothetical protein